MLLLKSPRGSTWNKEILDVYMLLFVWIWMLLLQGYIPLDLLYSCAVESFLNGMPVARHKEVEEPYKRILC